MKRVLREPLSRESVRESDDTLTATVTNTGDRPGREAVLWFLTDEVRRMTRPVRHLAHDPDEAGAPVLEPGDFTLSVGGQTARLRYAP
jgi:beta-glucosidase